MAKIALKTGKVTFNSVDYGITSLNVNEELAEVDVTDSQSTGSTSEYVAGRSSYSIEFTVIKDVTVADLTTGTAYTLVANYESNTYTGTAILFSKSIGGTLNGRMEVTYSGKFNGTVTAALVT